MSHQNDLTSMSATVSEEERTSRLAYDYFIDEIKREDGIVMSRLTSALALQGILFASLAFIVSSGVPADVVERDTIIAVRRMFQLVIVLAGLASSAMAWFALLASRDALDATRETRVSRLAQKAVTHLPYLPTAAESDKKFIWASRFPHGSMAFFFFIWLAVLAIYWLVVMMKAHVPPFSPTDLATPDKRDAITFRDDSHVIQIVADDKGKIIEIKSAPIK